MPIAAAIGDTIFTSITQVGSKPPINGYQVAGIRHAPSVVRTSPPSKRADVPINATILVVFSSPMDTASLRAALTLSVAGTPVAGTVTLPQKPGDVLTATFVPAASLAPNTAYEFDIAVTARDVGGATLTAPLVVTFTTLGTLPDVSITGPAPGDSMPVGYPSLNAHVFTANGIMSLGVMEYDAVHDSWHQVESETGYFYGSSGDGWFKMLSQLQPGPHTLKLQVQDSSGQIATSAPVNVVGATPDSLDRIAIRSFTVLEIALYVPAVGWEYGPQLIVADTLGSGPLQILGFEMLDIPGLQAPFPRVWAVDLAVPTAQDTQLFHELYGDFDLSFSAADGHRATGGIATARLTYRDRLGGLHQKTISGAVVSGDWPGTYSGGCGHWRSWGFEFDNCTSGLSLMVGGSPPTASANARRARAARSSP